MTHLGIISIFLHRNICCGYSLTSPWWGLSIRICLGKGHDSYEYPQYMYLWRTAENILSLWWKNCLLCFSILLCYLDSGMFRMKTVIKSDQISHFFTKDCAPFLRYSRSYLYQNHTRLTINYIRPFLYNIIKVSLQCSQSYFTKCIGYNKNCIGAHLIWLRNTPIQFVLYPIHFVK